MGYSVEVKHRRPVYRKGDLEDEVVTISFMNFKSRKLAKEYIEKQLSGKKDVSRNYHKGDVPSVCIFFTSKTWVNENTGDECEEYYSYIMRKV